jgi:hypothetical protein
MSVQTTSLCFMLLLCGSAAVNAGPQIPSDTQAIIDFQRAADAYAFRHRQVERVTGEADQARVTAALRAARVDAVEGAMFSPMVADAFRRRIQSAIAQGCRVPAQAANFVVPRLNESAANNSALDVCIARALPRLPDELQYKVAGVVLLLVDAHNDIVVDVLHGAFPVSDQ